MPRMTKAQKEAIEESRNTLREWCPPGTTIYTTCTHVARSGMSRRIRVFVMRQELEETRPWDITGHVARVLGYPCRDRADGMTVGGCGMDMGFHVVHSLSYALHGTNTVGADAEEHAGRPFRPTREQYRAGYSLEHRWL